MSSNDFVIHGHKGIELQARTWNVPQGTPLKAKIVFIHGFSEHKDCYNAWFSKVAEAGYQVTMFDQRGFGKTPKTQKEEGVTTDALQMADIEKVVNYVSKDYNGPLYLWGHSMGGGLTLTYAHRGDKRQRFDGYLANSPYIQGSPEGPNGSFLAKLLPLAYRILPNRREKVKITPDMCTNDSSRWDSYKNDPLRPNIGTTTVFFEMMKRGRDLLDESVVPKIVNKPILLSQGTQDVLCDVEGAKKFTASLKNAKKDITLKLYEHKPHELMQLVPKDQKEHLDDVLSWLDAQVAAWHKAQSDDKCDDKSEAKGADATAVSAAATTTAPAAAAAAAPAATTAAPTATKATEPVAEPKTAAPVAAKTAEAAPVETPAKVTETADALKAAETAKTAEPAAVVSGAQPIKTAEPAETTEPNKTAAAEPAESPKTGPSKTEAVAPATESAEPSKTEPTVEPTTASSTAETETPAETPEVSTPEPQSSNGTPEPSAAPATKTSKKSKKKKGKKGKN